MTEVYNLNLNFHKKMTFAIEKVEPFYECLNFQLLYLSSSSKEEATPVFVSPNTLSEMVCILADQLYSCVTAILK